MANPFGRLLALTPQDPQQPPVLPPTEPEDPLKLLKELTKQRQEIASRIADIEFQMGQRIREINMTLQGKGIFGTTPKQYPSSPLPASGELEGFEVVKFARESAARGQKPSPGEKVALSAADEYRALDQTRARLRNQMARLDSEIAPMEARIRSLRPGVKAGREDIEEAARLRARAEEGGVAAGLKEQKAAALEQTGRAEAAAPGPITVQELEDLQSNLEESILNALRSEAGVTKEAPAQPPAPAAPPAPTGTSNVRPSPAPVLGMPGSEFGREKGGIVPPEEIKDLKAGIDEAMGQEGAGDAWLQQLNSAVRAASGGQAKNWGELMKMIGQIDPQTAKESVQAYDSLIAQHRERLDRLARERDLFTFENITAYLAIALSAGTARAVEWLIGRTEQARIGMEESEQEIGRLQVEKARVPTQLREQARSLRNQLTLQGLSIARELQSAEKEATLKDRLMKMQQITRFNLKAIEDASKQSAQDLDAKKIILDSKQFLLDQLRRKQADLIADGRIAAANELNRDIDDVFRSILFTQNEIEALRKGVGR